ncbi:hypothetical protein NM962_06205 [Mycobacterium sp. SVM_VP21]|nr:hypothetical protein NM962_06205 [Mycobacterium sp. SVM_VP21]
MSSTAAAGIARLAPGRRLEVRFAELAELAGQRNAIDGRVVEHLRQHPGRSPSHSRPTHAAHRPTTLTTLRW